MASIGTLGYTIGTTTVSIYTNLTGLQTDGVTYRLKVWISNGDIEYSGNVRYVSTQQVAVSFSGLTPNTYYDVNTRLQYLPTGGSWTDSTVTRAGSFTTKGQTTYSYYLTLYGNGGSWNGTTYISDYDTSTSTSYTFYLSGYTQPTRSGYTFEGWYTAATGGTKITSITATSSSPSKEVYAHWTYNIVTYYLTYSPNGGTGSSVTDTIQGVPDSSGYISTQLRGQTFTHPYATQSGWHTSDSTEYALQSYISINANTTVYATWDHDTTSYFYWLGSDSADWNANTGIVQSASVTNMTATAWKGIGTKIRALQSLLGDTPSHFTTSMQSGDVFEADFYNEVTDALNEIVDNHSLNIAVPNDTAKGNVLFAYLFNGGASIKQCLNNIIQWYNTR